LHKIKEQKSPHPKERALAPTSNGIRKKIDHN
jgi:hypothetical protein